MMRHSYILTAGILGIALPVSAQIPTARVGDVTNLQGQGTNVLVGYGLVTGLDKTGDGGKFLPTMRALAAAMERFGSRVESVSDIEDAKNVAVVMVEAVIPAHGAREGEMLDVSVTALAAKSLMGGRLMPTPLIYHDRGVEGLFAFAQGGVVINENSKAAGVIHGGARLERDVLINVVTRGQELVAAGFGSPWIEPDQTYLTLVLDEAHAGWSMAAAIAQALDKELSISADVERVALAMDSKNVVVLIPAHQRTDPASWIRDVEKTPLLMESNEARVTINRNTGTIVVTGDTRISPVVISQLGMTVTVNGSAARGGEVQHFVPVDVAAERLPNVSDLLEALNRLKVPFKERVAILEAIQRSGKLHARITYEG